MRRIEEKVTDLDPERQALLELLAEEEGIDFSLINSSADNQSQQSAYQEYVQDDLPAEEAIALISREVNKEISKDLLIYMHIPFCSSKCLFCDWVADVPVVQLRGGPSMRASYVEGLVTQIKFFGPKLMEMGYTPRYIYWGGGTPSKLEPEEVEKISATLRESFDLTEIEEHTIETSPETLTMPKLKAMLASGIRRISMGVQSFNDEELRRSARSHSAKHAEEAVRLIYESGFENVNLDLIAAFPNQTAEMLQYTLRKTVELNPSHVTVYLYRATPQTVMAEQMRKGQREVVGLQKIFQSYKLAQTILGEAGYEEYTLGYFAKKPQYKFKGEEYYYSFQGDYIGFGSGAGSIMGHHYFKNSSRDQHAFIDQPLKFEHCVRLSAIRFDLIADILRLAMLTDTGIDYKNFKRLFGFNFSEIRNQEQFLNYLRYYKECGAVFLDSDERLSMTAETRNRAHLMSYALTLPSASGSPVQAAT